MYIHVESIKMDHEHWSPLICEWLACYVVNVSYVVSQETDRAMMLHRRGYGADVGSTTHCSRATYQ